MKDMRELIDEYTHNHHLSIRPSEELSNRLNELMNKLDQHALEFYSKLYRNHEIGTRKTLKDSERRLSKSQRGAKEIELDYFERVSKTNEEKLMTSSGHHPSKVLTNMSLSQRKRKSKVSGVKIDVQTEEEDRYKDQVKRKEKLDRDLSEEFSDGIKLISVVNLKSLERLIKHSSQIKITSHQ